MSLQVALCQLRPVLGDAAQNLAAHHAWLDRALEAKAQLVIFPELSLHGYFLRDLTQEVALPIDHQLIQDLVARSRDCSIVFGFVEESADHRFYNTAVFAEDGKILHAHRKVHLPDYGIFEEGRYFAAGDSIDVVQSKHGRFGLMICEDAWHLSTGWLQFIQGSDALILPSASPARGIDTADNEMSTQASWNTLVKAHALFFQSWVLHCNRVGFEDGAMFWGGSSVLDPFGEPLAVGGQDEELVLASMEIGPLRRARMSTPLRRDAKPELIRRHLARLLQDPDAMANQREDSGASSQDEPPAEADQPSP
jgi:predicted amidohydrolase